jgi:hypothetical protein
MTVQIIQNIANWQEVADYTRNLLDRVGTAETLSIVNTEMINLKAELKNF